MNQPPPRHPLFVAIAVIALAGAWGTGAYEAETGESVALVSPAVPTPQELGAECPGPRGPTRAVCLFEASHPASLADISESVPPPRRSGAVAPPVAHGVQVASRRLSTEPLSP